MAPHDTLALLAQIAVAIAGFSSVVAAFGGRGEGRWTRADRLRLRGVVGESLAVLFFSFLPVALRLLRVHPDLVWSGSSAALALFIVVWNQRLYTETRKVVGDGPRLDPWLALVHLGLHVVALVLQLLNLVGPFVREPAPFVVGLILLLLAAAMQFVRLVFTRIDTDAGRPAP